MKKTFFALPLVLLSLGCKKTPGPDNVLRLRQLTRDYFFFAAPGSWWKMQSEQFPDDTFRFSVGMNTIAEWEYPNKDGKTYELGIAMLEGERFESDVRATAEDSSDRISVHFGRFQLNNNGSFSGTQVAGLEDSVIINGKRYDRVLHLKNPSIERAYSDFWIAPEIGIIKLSTRDSSHRFLIDYKIVPQ